jgi:hypothetical protein
MKTILSLFILLALAPAIHAAETSCDFTVTSEGGEILGSGKIRLPFKLGTDGKGTAAWQFTPTQVTSTNKFWERAKERLGAGKGKATAAGEKGRLTLDFNPGWADNNATMMWALETEKAGTLYFADFAGGHPCASFRISRPAQPKISPNDSPKVPGPK